MPGQGGIHDSGIDRWDRFRKLRSIGITGRLVFSFAAVAILAAVANIIAEHGIAVIRTTKLDQGMVASPVYVPPPPAPAPAKLAPEERAEISERRLPAIRPESLSAAIVRYHRAIEVRAAIDTPDAVAEVRDSARDLRAAATAVAAAVSAWHIGAAPMAARTDAYTAAGDRHILASDQHRTAIAEYNTATQDIDRHLTGSLNGAMKIFGRVLARQSLLQLRADLEDLRRCFTQLDGGDESAAAAMSASERRFSATFDKNAASFTRSEGDPWVRRIREDFDASVRLRQSMATLTAQAAESAAEFDRVRDALLHSVPKARAEVVVHAQPAVPAAAPSTPQPLATPLPPAAASPVTSITTTSTRTDAHDRRTVAWITAAVLAVLLAISVGTVRSILIPVSRMLDATNRIAGGDVDVRVPGGGIKELDTLGVSFNRMAAQLAEARDMTRDYQQRLEHKVEQRTRELQHLAEHDPLTMLPNRRQLFVLLNHALERAAQNGRYVAVFFMDIDNFKNLNDSMGHAFGDQVLTEIAQRLKRAAHSYGFAGRLGGDEFTVVYEDADSEEVVREAGDRLVNLFDQPIVIDGRDVIVRGSVGASVYPNHGSRAEDLLSAADAALFQAKALGRGRLAVFTPELLATATHKFTIEQGMRRAIERDEFELVFQPEVSLESKEIVLVESLLRWRLPDGRQAPPAEFLPVTEESNLIIDVGNWVLRKAIETAAHWHHGEWPDARVAINVSPRQLVDPAFVANVQALLREFNLPARCIELELTESVLQSGPVTLESLRCLRALDIAIALDDFGTGYSSLASLESLPLTRIKLDRSLIAGIDSSTRSSAITTALIGLCKSLELEVTAEGVERPEQFAALTRYRTINLQGYLISKPIAAAHVMQARRFMPGLVDNLLLSTPGTRVPLRDVSLERVPSLASVASNG